MSVWPGIITLTVAGGFGAQSGGCWCLVGPVGW